MKSVIMNTTTKKTYSIPQTQIISLMGDCMQSPWALAGSGSHGYMMPERKW